MRKPDDFSDKDDFRYYLGGKRIEYQQWLPSNADCVDNNEYCILTRPDDDHRWNDTPCTLFGKFICQL